LTETPMLQCSSRVEKERNEREDGGGRMKHLVVKKLRPGRVCVCARVCVCVCLCTRAVCGSATRLVRGWWSSITRSSWQRLGSSRREGSLSPLLISLVLQSAQLHAAERTPYTHSARAQTLDARVADSMCGAHGSVATATLHQQETNRSSSPCTYVCGMLDSKEGMH
jgi:hypothetical protein